MAEPYRFHSALSDDDCESKAIFVFDKFQPTLIGRIPDLRVDRGYLCQHLLTRVDYVRVGIGEDVDEVVDVDLEARRTRRLLFALWAGLAERMVIIQGEIRSMLKVLGLSRVHSDCLGAAHPREGVLFEGRSAVERQGPSDFLIFDVVTPEAYDGVVAAVLQLARDGLYEVELLRATAGRGCTVGRRILP